jgi:hypothetical protein
MRPCTIPWDSDSICTSHMIQSHGTMRPNADCVVETVASGMEPRCTGNRRCDIIGRDCQHAGIASTACPSRERSQKISRPSPRFADLAITMKTALCDSDFEPRIQPRPIAAPVIGLLTLLRRSATLRHGYPLILHNILARAKSSLNRDDLLIVDVEQDIGLGGQPARDGNHDIQIDNPPGKAKERYCAVAQMTGRPQVCSIALIDAAMPMPPNRNWRWSGPVQRLRSTLRYQRCGL